MKARKLISAVAAILAAGTILTGCDTAFGRSIQNMFAKSEIVYQASTKFLYSVDGGKTWSQTIQEIPVDEYYNKMINEFECIGVNVVTLDKDSEVKFLPSLFEYLR